MKAVVQRVLKASVSVSGELVSAIDTGLCVLVGIARDDTDKDLAFIARKLLSLRVFADEAASASEATNGGGRWNKCVVDRDLELLCVSQFTLQSTLKGNKPDFHLAMAPDQAKAMYEKLLATLRTHYKAEKVKDGKFGEYMSVCIENDGPVTIIVDSRKEKDGEKEKEAND